jgi:hypothetical protein
MRKIDRLGWAAGLAFINHGVRVGVRVSSPDHDVLERVVACCPPACKPTRSPVVEFLYSLRIGGPDPRPGIRHFHLLYGGSSRLARTTDTEEAFAALESDLAYLVAYASSRRVFVQAGVVGWRGQAILIPGPKGSGKTSLVAALVRAGASLYSDEFAVLDEHGRVHPYAKPLSIRHHPEARIEKRSAEEPGGGTGVKPLPVGLIAMTEYRPNARWRPRPVSPGQSTIALLANAVPARRRPAVVFETLQRVTATAIGLRGIRGEADQMADSLLARLA